LVKFFSRLQKGSYAPDEVPRLDEIVRDSEVCLDIEVEASGYTELVARELEMVSLDIVNA